ncbi:MAG: iron transporter permease [Thermoleophilia bacterium]|nr:iron transporter permease [Thermoleophilia bacterium]
MHLGAGSVARELLGLVPGVDAGSGLDGRDSAILLQLRLPRVVLGALVGATLAVAGAGYQGAFRNPLADPYLLGAAAGAGLGATLVIAYAPHAARASPVGALPVAAFAGALLGVAASWAIGASVGRARSTATLLLAGVAVASFLTAVQTLVQQRRSDSLREVYGWILGGLGGAGWSDVLLVLPYALASMAVVQLHARLLDVLGVGDEEAAALGIDPARVRLVVVAAASLGTAAAVAVSGLVGFVGLVVPHVVRSLGGRAYRVLVPLAAVGGAAFVVAADLVARTALAPAEVPLGVVTAFVGAPFFAVVLRTRGGGGVRS